VTASPRIGWKRVDPPRRPVLFVNPSSGGGAGPRIAEQAEKRGITVNEFAPDRSLVALVGEAVAGGADALAVAGGDGSLATVVAAAVAHDLPFTCVPAGTRNHFARDLGLDPAEPIGALDAFSDGIEGPIDVGEVNGRVFVNNVSLGVYAEAVREPGYRDARVRTLIETTRGVFGPGAEISELDIVDDLGVSHTDPMIVLVSNNPYALGGPFSQGARPTLSGGRLGIIVIDRPVGGHRPSGREWSAVSQRVGAPNPVHAGLDGEAVELTPPLEFVVRPLALRVRVPRRSRAGARVRLRPAVPWGHR
jgi:diacylglycerol kinase family enzyme